MSREPVSVEKECRQAMKVPPYSPFNMTLRQLLIPLVLGSYSLNISAQSTDLWRTVPLVSATRQGRIIIPDQALGIRLDTTVMRDRLAHADRGSVRDLPSATAVITLPLPNGAFQRFLYLETPLMEDRMRDRYPFIRTYSGFAK